jgi:hypothetical protein
MFIEKKERDA